MFPKQRLVTHLVEAKSIESSEDSEINAKRVKVNVAIANVEDAPERGQPVANNAGELGPALTARDIVALTERAEPRLRGTARRKPMTTPTSDSRLLFSESGIGHAIAEYPPSLPS